MSELKRTDQPDGTTDQPVPAKPPAELRPSREPYAAHLDKPLAEGQPTAREVLDRFDPTRANLPDLTPTDAVTYLDTHAKDRPWLTSARGHDLPVQRLFAALDQGQGHTLERHEGYPSDSLLDFRVRYLQDPAQLDLTKRLAAEDAFTGKDHRCASTATRIGDPEAFATAFARGIEHPKIRAVLDQPFQKGLKPGSVDIPLTDLLGPEGHRFCSGRRLREVGDSMEAAVDCRSAWVDAYRKGVRPDVPVPVTVPIESFEGASVQFAFRANQARTGYEVLTMYVNPPEDDGGQ